MDTPWSTFERWRRSTIHHRLPATSGQAGRKYLEPEEWDFWYEGKPAAKELPDPFGTIIVEKGEVRDGGSYWNRFGNIAVWNSLMDESDYLVKRRTGGS